MKMVRKIALVMAGVVMATCIQPMGARAASVKLNKSKLTLEVGTSKQLKVKGTKAGKVKWSSSKKKIATVSKKGKVTAVKIGKTDIIAKVGKKKLKCRVTVKNNGNDESRVTDNGGLVTNQSTNVPVANINTQDVLAPTPIPTSDPNSTTINQPVDTSKPVLTTKDYYTALGNYVVANGYRNSEGGYCIDQKIDSQSQVSIVYYKDNSFRFIHYSLVSNTEAYCLLTINLKDISKADYKSVLVNQKYGYGYKCSQTINVSTYNENDKLTYKIDSSIGMTEQQINDINNKGLSVLLAATNLVTYVKCNILISNLGFVNALSD